MPKDEKEVTSSDKISLDTFKLMIPTTFAKAFEVWMNQKDPKKQAKTKSEFDALFQEFKKSPA